MKRNLPIYLAVSGILFVTLACSLSNIQRSATSAEKTAQALRTDVSGLVSEGSGLLKTAQAVETEHPGVLGTVKAVVTQEAPFLSTIEAASTNSPGLVQTAQAIINNEIPTGEPPPDIPILDRSQTKDFIGYSQYIFYISPSQYQDVLDFYQTEMPNNGWQYQESDSHEYANASQMVFSKNTRTATIDLSVNPLNNTTVVVINISNQ